LAPAVQSYAARYPDVVPDVTLADRQADLVDEGFDVGILIGRPARSASIVTRRLTTCQLTVCATPAYLERHGTPTRPEDLRSHPCLSRPPEQGGEERVFS
ncbi:LysR family transcriptional regulator, partial [Mesorhizobium sp. M3A.F.Ca.ET.174.01.1.1]